MNRLEERAAAATGSGITLVLTDGPRHNEALLATVRDLVEHCGQGVVVTANQPASVLLDGLARGDVDTSRLHVVDCVSSLAGMAPQARPRVAHVESPALLETIALRADQALRRLQGRKFLVVDSLSALSAYTGEPMVAEMAHALATRLRLQDIPAALLAVKRQAGDALLDAVQPLCDHVRHA